jgi:hypothetical protein
MQEQTAVLVEDHGEWVLVIDDDDDEAEQVWQSVEAAMEELRIDGWEVAEGLAPIRPSIAGFDRFDLWGYRLRRSVQ